MLIGLTRCRSSRRRAASRAPGTTNPGGLPACLPSQRRTTDARPPVHHHLCANRTRRRARGPPQVAGRRGLWRPGAAGADRRRHPRRRRPQVDAGARGGRAGTPRPAPSTREQGALAAPGAWLDTEKNGRPRKQPPWRRRRCTPRGAVARGVVSALAARARGAASELCSSLRAHLIASHLRKGVLCVHTQAQQQTHAHPHTHTAPRYLQVLL